MNKAETPKYGEEKWKKMPKGDGGGVCVFAAMHIGQETGERGRQEIALQGLRKNGRWNEPARLGRTQKALR
jgi:hypothetical protein